MLNITIKTIPHDRQRYPTVGDYYEENFQKEMENGALDKPESRDVILVSEMNNTDHEFLVAFHELIEMYLCKKNGISEEEITRFDIVFEEERMNGNHAPTDEPGHHPDAPYHQEHVFAETMERLMALALKVDWKKYDNIVNSL